MLRISISWNILGSNILWIFLFEVLSRGNGLFLNLLSELDRNDEESYGCWYCSEIMSRWIIQHHEIGIHSELKITLPSRNSDVLTSVGSGRTRSALSATLSTIASTSATSGNNLSFVRNVPLKYYFNFCVPCVHFECHLVTKSCIKLNYFFSSL